MSDPLDVPVNQIHIRKGVLFILAIVIMVALYQIVAYNFVLPHRPIVWRRGDLKLLEDFEQKRMRIALLVMLEQDANPSVPHQMLIFDDPQVREALNRLRANHMLLLIEPQNDEQRQWLTEQPPNIKLPFLQLFVAGYDPPITISTAGQDASSLAKLLDDVRFQRYER